MSNLVFMDSVPLEGGDCFKSISGGMPRFCRIVPKLLRRDFRNYAPNLGVVRAPRGVVVLLQSLLQIVGRADIQRPVGALEHIDEMHSENF